MAEQQCVDCDPKSEGCNGGWMNFCFEYLKNRNLCTETEYPYTGTDNTCNDSKCKGQGWQITGYVDLAEGDCEGLENADDNGPVSIAVDATAMQFYSSGIIKRKNLFCGDKPDSLNHGISIHGETKDYWLAKNSWGSRWGE